MTNDELIAKMQVIDNSLNELQINEAVSVLVNCIAKAVIIIPKEHREPLLKAIEPNIRSCIESNEA